MKRPELVELDGSAVGQLDTRGVGVGVGEVTKKVALDEIDERGHATSSDSNGTSPAPPRVRYSLSPTTSRSQSSFWLAHLPFLRGYAVPDLLLRGQGRRCS